MADEQSIACFPGVCTQCRLMTGDAETSESAPDSRALHIMLDMVSLMFLITLAFMQAVLNVPVFNIGNAHNTRRSGCATLADYQIYPILCATTITDYPILCATTSSTKASCCTVAYLMWGMRRSHQTSILLLYVGMYIMHSHNIVCCCIKE